MAEVLAPFADRKGIALLNTRGTYLESSKKSINEKLTGAEPEFKGTDEEIYLATQNKKEICRI